jgi:hypothetical protein
MKNWIAPLITALMTPLMMLALSVRRQMIWDTRA